MQRNSVWMSVVLALASIGVLRAQQADTILYNGKVLTVDAKFNTAEAVAVRGDKIAAVGKNDEVLKLAGPNTLKIDLKGRTVTPGLINTHTHVDSGAQGNYGGELTAAQNAEYPINFRAVKTEDDVLKQIKDTLAAYKFKPGEWILFSVNPRGDQGKILWEDLTRWDLDKVSPDNPIVLAMGVPTHNGVLVNSKAIDILWGKYGTFIDKYGRYWLDANGKPNGVLEPPAARLVDEYLPAPKPEVIGPLYRKSLEEVAAQGVTTVSSAMPEYSVEAYKYLDEHNEIPVRMAYGVQDTFGVPDKDMKDLKMGSGTDRVWISSMSARAVDGAGGRMCIDLKRDIKAAAAAEGPDATLMGMSSVVEWYPRGQCNLDIEYNGGTKGARIKGNYFLEWYEEVARDGLRAANTHVSGNSSTERLIAELEKINKAKPGSVKGWGLDHCTMVTQDQVKRMARLGAMFSCTPLGEGNRADIMATTFGEAYAHSDVAPIKSMVDAGINVSLEGEGGGHWRGIQALVTRKDNKGKAWGPNQAVDRVTALRIATQNGATYILKGDKLGSIEPGKLADLVIIDQDYMTIPQDEIGKIKTLLTMVGGRVVFLHSDYATETGLKPAGALISTPEELQKRRKRFQSSRG